MKKCFWLLSLIIVSLSAFSQKVELDEINNGVRRIQSKSETIEFEEDFRYNLEKFICNDESQYFIRGRMEENSYHNFPCNCKLLLKSINGEIVELTSVLSEFSYREPHLFSTITPINGLIWEPIAYYPITKEQLLTLFSGITKIRVEVLSYNKEADVPFVDYPELEFKKDKMGKQFKEMFDNIEKKQLTQPNVKKSKETKKKKKEKGTSLERSNATDGF